MIGTDAAGQSGFADRVNNHWGAILRAGLLSTLLGVGTQASGFGDNDAIADAIRDSAGQTVGRAGDRIVERQLGVQPTITIRPGARVRVLVGRDLVLAPFPGD
jgi:type IV secretion system protein VirB10